MKVETQWDEGGGVSGWWWSEGGGTFWRKVAGLMGDDEGEGGGVVWAAWGVRVSVWSSITHGSSSNGPTPT